MTAGEARGLETAPRRGRRGQANPEARRRLLATARELMTLRPAHEVTIRAVAERAGFDPALVHYYFGSKAGLVEAVLDESIRDLKARLERVVNAEGSFEERLRSIIPSAARALGEDPYLPQLIIEQLILGRHDKSEELVQRLATPFLWDIVEMVEDGIDSGRFRPVDPRTLVYSLSAIPLFLYLLSPLYRQLFGQEAITPAAVATLADAMGDLLLYGVMIREDGR